MPVVWGGNGTFLALLPPSAAKTGLVWGISRRFWVKREAVSGADGGRSVKRDFVCGINGGWMAKRASFEASSVVCG